MVLAHSGPRSLQSQPTIAPWTRSLPAATWFGGMGLQARSWILLAARPRLATGCAPSSYLVGSELRLVLCQPCSAVFMADLLPCGMTVEGGDGEAVPGDVDG